MSSGGSKNHKVRQSLGNSSQQPSSSGANNFRKSGIPLNQSLMKTQISTKNAKKTITKNVQAIIDTLPQIQKVANKANATNTHTAKRAKQDDNHQEQTEIEDFEMDDSNSSSHQTSILNGIHSSSPQKTDNYSDFTLVQSRKQIHAAKRNNKDQLPAIRLRLSEQTLKEFQNPIKRQSELKKCFPKKHLVIKFMEFAKFDPKILLIATDDQETHDLLNDENKWPKDAFNRGIQLKTKGNTPPAGNSHGDKVITYNFSIRMPSQIEIEDNAVQREFIELGFNKAVRTIKKLDNTPSSFVRLTTTHKELYEEHIYKRKPLLIFYQRFYAVQEVKPRQCWNCQGLGHLAFDCPENKPKCLQCGEPHRVKECTNVDRENNIIHKTFCSNCKQPGHTASARVCPILQIHVKKLIQEKKDKQFNQIKTNTNKIVPSYATVAKNKTQEQNTQQEKDQHQSTSQQQQQKEEIKTLNELVKELIQIVSSLLKNNSTKLTISRNLQKIMNESAE
jgi:ribosomal protein L12E/L44/L45/RPP1/RPP2